MKNCQKTAEKHYFARVCRTLGRFCMCIGAIFAIGGLILAFLQLTQPDFASQVNNIFQQNTSNNNATTPQPETASLPAVNRFALLLIAIAIVVAIIALFWRTLKSYNNALRKAIAKCANTFHAPIFSVEVILTLTFWILAVIFLTCELPLVGLYSLAMLIANELLFIFAWASYGRPAYTL